jgi:rubrerythrin
MTAAPARTFDWAPARTWTCPRCQIALLTREASVRCPRCGAVEDE